jgi:hypothetical protein
LIVNKALVIGKTQSSTIKGVGYELKPLIIVVDKVFHNSDTKLDNRYKLKFEIKWDEEEDGDVKEYTMSLSTTSAIQFINYVQGLAKQGIGVGQVVTKMTISRQKRQGSNDRYSRAEFENVGSAFE